MEHIIKRIVIFCFLSFVWISVKAADVTQALPTNPDVTVGQLKNGFSYYIQKNAVPEKMVELRFIVKAGSVLENDDQQGLAHFLEHMAFNGSRHFKRTALISYLQSIGMKFGADLNAYTGFNETVYSLSVPIHDINHLKTAFLVIQDWAAGLSLEDADIDAERPIVLEEARLAKGAAERVNRQLYPTLFNHSIYADRLPIGKEDIIRHFKPVLLRQFYHDWYRPDLMGLVVVGDIDPHLVQKMIKTSFAALSGPPNERVRLYPEVPERKQSVGMVITDKELTNDTVWMVYPIQKKQKESTWEDYRRSLIKTLGLSMLNMRLSERTQESVPPYLSANSSLETWVHGYESFITRAVVGRNGVKEALKQVIMDNTRIRVEGFTSEELDRAKENLGRFFEAAYYEKDKSLSSTLAAEYIRHFLVQEPIPGIVHEYQAVRRFLPTITLKEVNEYINRMTSSQEGVLTAYIGSEDVKPSLPSSEDLLDWSKITAEVTLPIKIEPSLPKTLMQPLEGAGYIVSEKHDITLGTWTFLLSNGLTVTVRPSKFKHDQVLLSAMRFGGQSLFDDADKLNARYASAIVENMGLGAYTPIELQKILAGKTVALKATLEDYTESITGESSNQDIASLFQWVYLTFQAPRVDTALYQTWLMRMEDASRYSLASPEAQFQETLANLLYQGHPRLATIPKPQDFKHLNLKRALSIYHERFKSAKGFHWVLTGNMDLKEIRRLITTYLAQLPTSDLVLTYHDMGLHPVKGVVKKNIYHGHDKSMISIVFTGDTHYSLRESVHFYALLAWLELRIIAVLREQLALVYSAGVGGAIQRVPATRYHIQLTLPCSPHKVDEVVSAVFEEIKAGKIVGPEPEELEKIKVNWLKNIGIDFKTNEYWLNKLQSALLFQTDERAILEIKKYIANIDSVDIQQAARRYLDEKNYVQLVLYPEKIVLDQNN